MAKQSYSVDEQVMERNFLGNRGVCFGYFGRERDTCSSFSFLFNSQSLILNSAKFKLGEFKYKNNFGLVKSGRALKMSVTVICAKREDFLGEWLIC